MKLFKTWLDDSGIRNWLYIGETKRIYHYPFYMCGEIRDCDSGFPVNRADLYTPMEVLVY